MRKRYSPTRLVVAVIMGLALLAAACSSGEDGASAETAGEESTAPTVDDGDGSTTTPEESAPTFEPGDGGTFRHAAILGVPVWDPAGVAQGFGPTFFDVAYDGLVRATSDGSLVPGLATEWEESDDSITFTLREGVTFHDGTPFDAQSVVYNIDRVKQVPNANASLLSAVEQVEVVSDHEVVFRLSERDPDLMSSLARMPGMMVSPNVTPEDIAIGVPAGTGPYQIVSFTEDLTVLERNPNYWDPSQQYADQIEFMVLADDEARLNALLTDRVDSAQLRPAQVPGAESAGFAIDQTVSDVGFLIVVDVGGESVPELNDERVRQAIAHSIDREAWGAAVGQGFGEPTFQFFAEGSPWHLDDWEGYDYDPELAQELLAEAGVEPGQVRLEMHTFGAFLLPAQVLQQMLADVGIQLEIIQIAPGGMLGAFEQGLIPVGYTLMSASHPETMWATYFDAELPRNAWSRVAPGADEARSGVADAPLDDLDAAYREMLRVIYEQAWGIPVWANSTILGFDAEEFPNVHGMERITQGVSIRELAPA